MGKDVDDYHVPESASEPRQRREEIIDAVLEGKSLSGGKKNVVIIPPSRSTKANFQEVVSKFNIPAGSNSYHIIKIFCDKKRGNAVDTKVLIQRMEGLSAEQLDVFEVICNGDDFTAKGLLKVIPSIKRFESDRMLILHAFVDLGKISPGPLDRFFIAALPQSKPSVVGKEAYEAELLDKAMTLEQVNVFYNICNRVPGITFDTAIALLPVTRKLKSQHAAIINTFLNKDSCFGEKSINERTIPSLLKLWLKLPEMVEWSRFKKLLKTLNRKPDKKKRDFKYIMQVYKAEIDRSKGSQRSRLVSSISNLFK